MIANETGMKSARHDGSRRLVVALALLAVLAAAPAPAQTIISFQPDQGQFQCHQTWTVNVMVDAGTVDLRAASLVVQFDRNILKPIAVTAGALVGGALCPNFLHWIGPADADSVAVDVAGLGCSVAGPGAIVRITFEGAAGGTSPITLRSAELRTGANASIPFTTVGAQVLHDCAVADEPATWGMIKTLYR